MQLKIPLLTLSFWSRQDPTREGGKDDDALLVCIS